MLHPPAGNITWMPVQVLPLRFISYRSRPTTKLKTDYSSQCLGLFKRHTNKELRELSSHLIKKLECARVT